MRSFCRHHLTYILHVAMFLFLLRYYPWLRQAPWLGSNNVPFCDTVLWSTIHPFTHLNLILFVDGSYCKNEKRGFPAGYAITTQHEPLGQGKCPQAQLAQHAEAHVLTRVRQLPKGCITDIYTETGVPLRLSMMLGCYGNKGVFLFYKDPNKNGQQVNNLLIAILLPSEVTVTKTESY